MQTITCNTKEGSRIVFFKQLTISSLLVFIYLPYHLSLHHVNGHNIHFKCICRILEESFKYPYFAIFTYNQDSGIILSTNYSFHINTKITLTLHINLKLAHNYYHSTYYPLPLIQLNKSAPWPIVVMGLMAHKELKASADACTFKSSFTHINLSQHAKPNKRPLYNHITIITFNIQ